MSLTELKNHFWFWFYNDAAPMALRAKHLAVGQDEKN
jgi:hypothetical protein